MAVEAARVLFSNDWHLGHFRQILEKPAQKRWDCSWGVIDHVQPVTIDRGQDPSLQLRTYLIISKMGAWFSTFASG